MALVPIGSGTKSNPTYPAYYPSDQGAGPKPPVSSGGNLFSQADSLGHNVEQTRQGTNQKATNVLNVLNQLRGSINTYGNQAQGLYQAGLNYNPSTVNLSQHFAGQPELNNLLSPAIDFLGQQGISAGLQNLNLQEAARQKQLATGLGRNAGNQSLLDVLRAQGGLQMGLAAQPLIAQANQGTFERGLAGINLQNQNIQNANTTQLAQAGFNNQAEMGRMAAQAAAMQPYQNLLETLTNLQGQGRGVSTVETGIGQRNYK